jgi:hypothetical protein
MAPVQRETTARLQRTPFTPTSNKKLPAQTSRSEFRPGKRKINHERGFAITGEFETISKSAHAFVLVNHPNTFQPLTTKKAGSSLSKINHSFLFAQGR